MICDECETVAHCTKHGCVPKHQALDRMAENARELGLDYETETVNLDTASGFTFSDERGTFIGDVQMLKWLVEHHSEDYWKAKAGETK